MEDHLFKWFPLVPMGNKVIKFHKLLISIYTSENLHYGTHTYVYLSPTDIVDSYSPRLYQEKMTIL